MYERNCQFVEKLVHFTYRLTRWISTKLDVNVLSWKPPQTHVFTYMPLVLATDQTHENVTD
jgi:hypothetical protein